MYCCLFLVNRVVTLERENERSEISVARIYSFVNDHKYELSSCNTIPIRTSIINMCCCAQTGRLLLATTEMITLWSSNPLNEILQIELYTNKPVLQLTLFNQYLAYATESDVRIIELKIKESSINNSTISTDNNNNNNNNSISNNKEMYGTVIQDEYFFECVFDQNNLEGNIDMELMLNSSNNNKNNRNKDRNNKDSELLGPVIDYHGIKMNKEHGYEIESCILVLHRHFEEGEEVHTLQLIKNQVEIMECVIATQKRSYVYNLIEPSFHCLYEFTTTDTVSCSVGQFLFTISHNALEIWTRRSSNYKIDKYPTPCLIGLFPFISSIQISLTSNLIVLLSKFSDNNNNNNSSNNKETIIGWNLYVLQIASSITLHNELLSTALMYKETNSNVYIQLLFEDFTLLEYRLNYFNKFQIENEEYNTLCELKKNITGMIGDYYFTIGDCSVASLFYSQSNYSIHDIINKFERNSNAAIINYLDIVLFDKNNKVHVDLLDAKTGDLIIQVYYNEAPTKLSNILLTSYLQCYTIKNAIELIETINNRASIIDDITLLLLYLQFIEEDEIYINKCISTITKYDSISLVNSIHNNSIPISKLLNNNNKISLLELFINQIPHTALELVTQVSEQNTDYISTILDILFNYSNITPLLCNTDNQKFVLICYLEFLLNNMKISIKINNDIGIKTEELIGKLIIEYFNLVQNNTTLINKIMNTTDDINKWKINHNKTFIECPLWINQLPPFVAVNRKSVDISPNVTSSTNTSINKQKNPYHQLQTQITNHLYLRKLLSLISLTPSLVNNIKMIDCLVNLFSQVKEIYLTNINYFSLYLLISGVFNIDVESNLFELLQLYPSSIVDYSIQFANDIKLWKLILNNLFQNINEIDKLKQTVSV